MQQQLKLRSKGKPRRVTKNSVSAFISKTYEFLEDNQFPEIVDWNFEGTSIVIKNPVEFAQKVLNQYFKHRNLTSFVRQLNMYGFHKQRTHKVEYVYSHELFQRNKKHLLDQIKRKNQDQISMDSSDTVEESCESDISSPDLSTLMQEKQALKRYNNQAYDKITRLEGKIKDLSLQNQVLKDQVSQQGEKDKILISLMASILQKYGIPPNELSSIMKKDIEEPLMQSLSYSQASSNFSVNSSKISEGEGDISNYLNFGADIINFKSASTVLTEIVNFDDRQAHRDVSPYARVNCVEPDFQWESSFGQKYYLPNCGTKEVHCTPMKTQCASTIPYFGSTESNLVKRKFEEENNFGGYGYETYETIKKKFEIAPSVHRNDETHYYMSVPVEDGRRKSRSNEDLFDPNQFNFTQSVWI